MLDVGKFQKGKSLERHLNAVEKKLDELAIPKDQKASMLLRTLDDEIELELRSCHDFVEDYAYIVAVLREFYGADTTSVSLCSALLNIKQKPGQSIRDFMSEIRVATMRLFPDRNADEREKILIMSFIEGLQNQKHAIILKQHNPATLYDAYSLLKNEKVSEETFVMKIDNENQSEIMKLNHKLEVALRRINDLEFKISSMVEMKNNVKRSFKDPKIICHLCRLPGHIKRNCKMRQSCQICFKSNHATKDCFFKESRNKNIRNVENESIKSASMSEIEDRGDPLSSIPENDYDEKPFNDAYVVQNLTQKKVYPKDVENWANYVSGNGAKPRIPLKKEMDGNKYEGKQSRTPTVISKSRNERAANKPVVPAVVEGKIEKNIFFDSGCECNIVDYSFLKSVARVNPNIKLLKSKGEKLSCANGSPINVMGQTVLNIKVGGKSMKMKFVVVESIFPNILIGIKSMKREKVCIVPAWDCVKIEGISVPFVSKIEADSLN